MGITKFKGMTWYPIRSGNPCPVCGSKQGRCAYLMNEDDKIVMFRCKNATSSRPSSDGWYLHLAKDIPGFSDNTSTKFLIRQKAEVKITEDVLNLRNSVYQKFRQIFKSIKGSYIPYEDDKQDLFVKRNLTESQVENMLIFSCPRLEKVYVDGVYMQLKTAIVNKLLNFFNPEELLKVPGFCIAKNKNNGNEFITFKTGEGYFIPYSDESNRINAMQYRLTTPIKTQNGKLLRYLWFSSEFSSGSPIDVYVPSKVKRDDILLISEGALKTKIASELLKVKALAEAGVSNYKQLVKKVNELEVKDNINYKIIIALDMDKYNNNDVLTSEINTIKLLKISGHQIAIAEWSDSKKFKGIDDALINGCKLEFNTL